eukprot:CAMPEP_0118924134 /NCGR_PEP_ID=MMETSP1169-20130426/2409_1 /TAXON_ID=36882 /ORGANISM="Pyramimonas obovata, Strain CCMP722" /LENGTH=375 /DNA_ID=CAMNT_0006865221 /DNA_START=93 /DNA_END=1216 /DNA_ORIENTATION=+
MAKRSADDAGLATHSRGGEWTPLSSGGEHRYTQAPSRVLHLRNLPWDCTVEDLKGLCESFGQVVQTKMNVGANKNQAFVEFSDVNQAITMLTYYGTNSEPAQIKGKSVYLQYSTRQEIVNSSRDGDAESNVLLVSIDDIGPNATVTIEILHLVFAAFGDVHKIATFEKTAGFQALIQYDQLRTAEEAKAALDGRSIPRYLLPAEAGKCTLRISYSAHTDLNVKFQSYRSRDYKNPHLPVAPSATPEGYAQYAQGGAGAGGKRELESNVLLCNLENNAYPVTVSTIHTVFSPYGAVQKVAIFEKGNGTQVLVQYPDLQSAATAKLALEGHAIYDGGYCRLKCGYSRHTDLNVKMNSERSWDYTGSNLQPQMMGPPP